jgi:S1-C subfamily serine protease
MKSSLFTRMFIASALVACSWARLQAQSHSKSVSIQSDDIKGQPYTLNELGAVVVQNNQGLLVMFVMEPDMRPEAYKEVDLQAEDVILMANGKKLESIDDLENQLEGLAIGDQVQLGIKRDKDMQIVRYLKADPESLPKMKRMMVTAEEGEDGKAKREMSFQSAGGEERVSMLQGTGIIARETDGHVQVAYLMPQGKETKGVSEVKEGDLVVRIQGKTLASLDDLDKIWESIATGDEVTMVCSRDDKEFSCTFTKPDASDMQGGAVMITK